jgi:transposase, IS30 family
LNEKKRDRIEALLDGGETQKEIAKILKVDKSTISREVRRIKHRDGQYDAEAAECSARTKRRYSKYQGMKLEHDPELKRRTVAMLEKKRSPDEIAGRLSKELGVRLGKNAIYKWLYSAYGQRYCRYLCTRRYKKKPQTGSSKREMIPNRVHISSRPRTKGLVHFEGDTSVSPRNSHSKHAAAFAIEQESCLILGRRTENMEPGVVSKAFIEMTRGVKADDITFDNGLENRYHEEIGIPSYFCDANSPWQKPHVECGIGLIRKWFVPKGTDWKTVSEEDLQAYIHILNSKYRKKLGYKNAYEVAYEKGILRSLPVEVAFEGGI